MLQLALRCLPGRSLGLAPVRGIIFKELVKVGAISAAGHDLLVDGPPGRSVEVLDILVHHAVDARPVGSA